MLGRDSCSSHGTLDSSRECVLRNRGSLSSSVCMCACLCDVLTVRASAGAQPVGPPGLQLSASESMSEMDPFFFVKYLDCSISVVENSSIQLDIGN